MLNIKSIGAKRTDEYPISIGGIEYKSDDLVNIKPSENNSKSIISINVNDEDGSVDKISNSQTAIKDALFT